MKRNSDRWREGGPREKRAKIRAGLTNPPGSTAGKGLLRRKKNRMFCFFAKSWRRKEERREIAVGVKKHNTRKIPEEKDKT